MKALLNYSGNQNRWYYLPVKLAQFELRSGLSSFKIFIICLVLGVTAITAISSLREAIKAGLENQSTEMLGGDASMSFTYRLASEKEQNFIKENSKSFTEIITLRSMVASLKGDEPIDSTVVKVKGIGQNYPIYGNVVLSPSISLAQALNEKEGFYGLVAQRSLIDRLSLSMGQTIRIGARKFQLRAELISEPDGGNPFSFAPKVIVLNESLISSNLIKEGTMFDSEYNIELLPNQKLEELKQKALENFSKTGMRWKDSKEATPTINNFIERFSSFLLLVGIAGLAVGGIGVASAVNSYIGSKRNTIAVLKTLGAKSTTIFQTYMLVILIITFISVVIGTILGSLVPIILYLFMKSFFVLPIIIDVYPLAFFEGSICGFLTALLFSIWPLAQMTSTNPATLFRSKIQEPKVLPNYKSIFLIIFLVLVSVILFAFKSEELLLTSLVFSGLIASLLVLSLLSLLLKRLSVKISSIKILQKFFAFRLALLSTGGPGNEVNLVVLALGLGLVVLATIGQIDQNLRSLISGNLSSRAPAFFLLDIQKSQLEEFKKALSSNETVTRIETAPMLRGVISKINNVPAETVAGDHWAVRGDRGITFKNEKPDNLETGSWWGENYNGPPQISFSADEAAELGIQLGDTITVNILGRDLLGTVTNFRNVDFSDMGINFLMIFNQSALENAPHGHIATIYAPRSSEGKILREINHNFQNVTAIPTKDALNKVLAILTQITNVTRWCAFFSILIGIIVLIGVAAGNEEKRTFEAAVLKTLGAKKSLILRSFAFRSIIIGAGAGFIALIIAGLASWGILKISMNSDYYFHFGSAFLIVSLGMVTNLFTGLVFSYKSMTTRPTKILKTDE